MRSPFDDVDPERMRRRRTVKWTLPGPDVLAAWVAEMDFRVAPPIRAALLDAIDREEFGYTEADLGELTAACAGYLARAHGWEVSSTRIFPVADVLAGIAGALDGIAPPDGVVVVPTPAYPPFFEQIGLGGRRVAEVPLVPDTDGRRTLDLDGIGAALRDGSGTLLLCNPQNPTGRVFTVDELAALAQVVERHGARVIADEVHAPLVYPGHRHVPYASVSDLTAAHTVTVTSASKGWNIPGLRCAQVIATNRSDAARWRTLPVLAVPGPTPLGVAASVAAYREGGPWLAELLPYLESNRDLVGDVLASELPELTWSAPEGTYLAWIDCAGLGVDDPATFFLEHARVAVNDGPPFGLGAEQHIRLNFATSRALLQRILDAMVAAVRAHHPKPRTPPR